MKIVTKTLLTLVVCALLPTALNAQSATASASAVIISPLTIGKATDMSFGTIIADTDGGTVTLDPTGSRTPSGINVIGSSPFTLATFNIAGQSGYTYSITLPAGATTIDDGAGGDAMTVDAFTSNPSGTGTIDANPVLTVGATLHIGAGQDAGVYNSSVANGGSGDFTVTVNYN